MKQFSILEEDGAAVFYPREGPAGEDDAAVVYPRGRRAVAVADKRGLWKIVHQCGSDGGASATEVIGEDKSSAGSSAGSSSAELAAGARSISSVKGEALIVGDWRMNE